MKARESMRAQASQHVSEHEHECVFQLPMPSLITVPCEAIIARPIHQCPLKK